MIPKTRPMAPRTEIERIINESDIDRSMNPVVIVGIRGYYRDTMGDVGKNDRGLYDDALFLVTPSVFLAVNANCDASKYRKGWGFGSEKGMASLNPGVWWYKTGIHYGSIPHAAFRQAMPVTVTRDGTHGPYQDTGMFAINIHRGGNDRTGSLGCQTIPPSQWPALKELAYSEIKRLGVDLFPYILQDGR